MKRIKNQDVFILNSLSILVGVLAGYAALAFSALVSFFQNLVLQNRISIEWIDPSDNILGSWYFLIPPVGLLIVASLSHFLNVGPDGYGIPEVIEAMNNTAGKIKSRVVATKTLISSLTIASGGSVGREGPILQIASVFGGIIGRSLKLPPDAVKTLLACGAAGGIAASFNTPIAAVIFSIEIIVGEFKLRSFVPLVLSSVFATVVARTHLGNEIAFFLPAYDLSNPLELFLFLILGILAGFSGIVFSKTILWVQSLTEKLSWHFTYKALVGGLLLSVMGYFYPQILGVGYDTMKSVLSSSSTWQVMLALIFLKTLAMSITLSCGGSGGIFFPALFVGAMLGGVYGLAAKYFMPDLVSSFGAYALVGMACLFAASFRASLTAIVLVFEMTTEYSIILPLMLACVISEQVAFYLQKNSLLVQSLKRKNITYSHHKDL